LLTTTTTTTTWALQHTVPRTTTTKKAPRDMSRFRETWERKTGSQLASVRDSRVAWQHVRAARTALADGLVATARASYNYYLRRFADSSQCPVFVADVCLRLAILEHNVGNRTGAKRVFRMGANSVTTALRGGSDASYEVFLRERAATLYCSWGLHEYKYAHVGAESQRLRLARAFLNHAASIDESKAGVLRWRRFADPASSSSHQDHHHGGIRQQHRRRRRRRDSSSSSSSSAQPRKLASLAKTSPFLLDSSSSSSASPPAADDDETTASSDDGDNDHGQ